MPADKNTTATTVQQVPPPSSHVTGENATFLGVSVASIIGAVLWLRRRTSRDRLEILKDRAEGGMVNLARDGEQRANEREQRATAEARDAYAKLNAMEREMGHLQATVAFVERENARVVAENDDLKRELSLTREQVTQIRQGVQTLGKRVDSTESNLKAVEKRTGESGTVPLGRE